MENKNVKMLLVSETHWDREWYLPFEGFRFKLVQTIDKALHLVETDPGFVNFTLDGQAIVLEDYLEARPANEERLKRAIAEGRLSTGPFYVLPDEFLISPEAHVRNLLLGRRVASSFGNCCNVGYLPDSFGHLAQVPAILNGFNIDSFVFMRGLGDEATVLGTEFEWIGQDGRSKVLAVNMPLGYGNVAGITRDKPDFTHATATVLKVRDKLVERARTNVLLLMNGVDHLAPEEKIPAFIDHFNKERGATEGTITHVTLDGFVDELRAAITRAKITLERFTGDLRFGKEHPILSDVFSSRVGLLQQNVACQALLERWVEPFSAIAAAVAGTSFPYPSDYIWLSWKHLLQNAPHDSICGCSVDEVHQDMEYRFRQVRQRGAVLARDAIRHLVPRVDLHPGKGEPPASPDTFEVLVFNPSPFPRSGTVSVFIEMQDFDEPSCPEAFVLRDASGAPAGLWEVPLDAPPVAPGKHKYLSRHYRLDFHATGVPATGFATYYLLAADDPEPVDASWATFDGTTLECDACKLSVNANGTFSATDKRTGIQHDGLCLLVDEPDAGDEYDFWPLPGNQPRFSSAGTAARVAGCTITGATASIVVDTSIDVPAGLKTDRSGMLDEMVTIPARITATVTRGKPGARFDVSVTNTAKDHRLRIAFPAPVVSKTKIVGQHFTTLEKPVELPAGDGWHQAPSTTDHFLDYFGVAGTDTSGKDAGLLVISTSSQEQEVTRGDEGSSMVLLATMVRAVGWLGRPVRGAGPDVRAPDAQCPGTHQFSFTVLPFTPVRASTGKIDLPDEAWHAIEEHRVPLRPVVLRGFNDWHNTEPLPAVIDYRRFDLPRVDMVDENNDEFLNVPKALAPITGFVSVEPACIALTTLKRADDGTGTILRACNLGRDPVDVTITLHEVLGVKGVIEVKLDEQTPASPSHDISIAGTRISARHVTHDEILTLKLVP